MTTRYEIRRKTYPFNEAPDLTGRDDAAYVPVLLDVNSLAKIAEGPRFGRALDAAQHAAQMNDLTIELGVVSGRCAFVRCDHAGPRPSGAMKGYAYVSYRKRERP